MSGRQTTGPLTTEPQSVPGEATAEDGNVVLDGPDGLAITLTAEAAMVTGERLILAGQLARAQNKTSPPK